MRSLIDRFLSFFQTQEVFAIESSGVKRTLGGGKSLMVTVRDKKSREVVCIAQVMFIGTPQTTSLKNGDIDATAEVMRKTLALAQRQLSNYKHV